MTDKYKEALGDLDRLRAEGKVTASQYELHKSRLLAEAESKRGRGMKALLTVAAIIVGILLIGLLSNLIV